MDANAIVSDYHRAPTTARCPQPSKLPGQGGWSHLDVLEMEVHPGSLGAPAAESGVQIFVNVHDTYVRVRLEGALTGEGCEELRERLLNLVDEISVPLAVDLSAVTALKGRGLAALLAGLKALAFRGSRLVLQGVDRQRHRIIWATGADEVFNIHGPWVR